MADVDFGDLLDYLARDAQTRAVLLYVEEITHARKFLSAARALSRLKPAIVVKAGRTAGAAKAAHSHTGALAGADVVYEAAFRRAGMIRAMSLEELFDAAETCRACRAPMGDRLAIVTMAAASASWRPTRSSTRMRALPNSRRKRSPR